MKADETPVLRTATPFSGWVFAYWWGDASATNNPLTVIMSTNTAITANFQQTTP